MKMRPHTSIPAIVGSTAGRGIAIALLVVGLAWGPARAALAQETPPAEAEQEEQPPAEEQEVEEDEGFREVITVTARKREEELQDVPFSVVAPTEDVLRERGADNLEDVSANVAGFNVQNLGPGQSQVAMRGISAGQVVRDQPGVKEQVGVYLDESVLSLSLFTPDIDLFDMSRVEVLRGPQGTLFGSGSLSGTVRYISSQPLLGVTEGVAELTVSAIDDGEVGGSAKVAINRPLGDKAALRITAYNTEFAGYMDAVQPNLSVDEDVNSGNRTGGRVAIHFQPNERLSIVPRVFYQEVDMDGWNRIDDYNILANPFTTTRPAVDLGERELFTQIDEPFTDEFLLGDLTIGYDFDTVTLTSITSYTDRDILVVRDATALTGSITGGSIGLPEQIYTLDAPLFDATTAKMLTQEFRLSGGTDRWVWLTGAFYSDIDRDYGQSLPVTGFEDLSGIPTRGILADKDELFFSDLAYDFEQFALFGEATYSFTDRFDLTGGLRYYDFDESRDQVFDGLFAVANVGEEIASQPGSVTADGVSPRVTARYAITDNTNLNAQVSNGFRLGGINDPLNVPLCRPEDLETFGNLPTWEDEEVWDYEVGSKSTFMGGRGTFNVAAYLMDVSDLQVTTTAGTCSSRIIFNVPDARSQGLELELTAQPTPSFDFAISASYNDSELKSSLTSGGEVIEGIEEGERLPTVPEFQAAVAASYRWQMTGNWAGYLTGAYQHVGSRFTQITDHREGFGTVNLLALPNTIGGPLTQNIFTFDPELPAYDIVNLRLGFLTDIWEVALFVNNVTDEVAFLALDQERGTLGRVGYLTNQPRTFGVTTRFRFW
ncbi:MAG: TonB-dependent receptor [Thermoanaerobaculia bacterium]